MQATSKTNTVTLVILKSKFIPNYRYLKENILGPENLLRDISYLR